MALSVEYILTPPRTAQHQGRMLRGFIWKGQSAKARLPSRETGFYFELSGQGR